MRRERIAPPRVATVSSFGLLIPLIAFVWTIAHGAGLRTSIAYGVAQVGYVLLASGVLAGSFKVLGLHSRTATLLWGVVAWVAGTILMNV